MSLPRYSAPKAVNNDPYSSLCDDKGARLAYLWRKRDQYPQHMTEGERREIAWLELTLFGELTENPNATAKMTK